MNTIPPKVSYLSIPDGEVIKPEDIARLLGIPLAQIPPSAIAEIQEKARLMDMEKKAVRTIMEPFYDQLMTDQDKNKKKIYELIDMGKFIYCFDRELKILACDEQPDFIIEKTGRKIGVEHTQIFNQPQQHLLGKLKLFLEETKSRVISKKTNATGLFNVKLDTSKINIPGRDFMLLKKHELDIFSEQLADHLVSMAQKTITAPDFIESIVAYPNPTLDIVLAESYLKQLIDPVHLDERIHEKEKRLERYKKNKQVDDCWLLLILSGKVSSSNFGWMSSQIFQHTTGFDRIFLYIAINNEVIELPKLSATS